VRRALSLRARLTAIILLPLLSLAAIAGLWQLDNARRTAAEVFDRSLLSAALAVSSDVAISGGDALSARTRDILTDTSGGPVFYHVYAPDGVIVTGYATPPVGIPRQQAETGEPTWFEARYMGRAVRGVRLQTRTEVDGFAGIFTTTVWQDEAVRSAFLRDLVVRSLITISGLIGALALIVWFGVRIGLRPLTDLQRAIARRSSDELLPIRRPVPEEVRGIVETLNRLFAQVSRAMASQQEFIANAAHQLRNPIAGVLSLAEAVQNAPDGKAARQRAADLVQAALEAADLGAKLLLFERARSISPPGLRESLALAPALQDWVAAMRSGLPEGVALRLDAPAELGTITADATMLREALGNLIDNALRHGGAELGEIVIAARVVEDAAGEWVVISVCDDGRGMAEGDLDRAMERFGQIAATSGSGLGLSIVQAVVDGHGGRFRLRPRRPGLCAEMELPRAP